MDFCISMKKLLKFKGKRLRTPDIRSRLPHVGNHPLKSHFPKITAGKIPRNLLTKNVLTRKVLTGKVLPTAAIFALSFFIGRAAAQTVEPHRSANLAVESHRSSPAKEVGDVITASADGNWGLSFQTEGQAPIGNATADYLKQYNAYYVQNTQDKVIYLTFDAGFENGNTAAILDALKKHNAQATFFLVGNYLQTSPDLVKRMVAEGHNVGNHTFHHPDMSKLSTKDLFEKESITKETFVEKMKQEYLIENENAWDNAIYVLEGHFVSNKEEYEKFANIEIVKTNTDDMLERMYSYTQRLSHAEFRKQMKDIVLVGLKRYKNKYSYAKDSKFVLYEKNSCNLI